MSEALNKSRNTSSVPLSFDVNNVQHIPAPATAQVTDSNISRPFVAPATNGNPPASNKVVKSYADVKNGDPELNMMSFLTKNDRFALNVVAPPKDEGMMDTINHSSDLTGLVPATVDFETKKNLKTYLKQCEM